MKAKVKAFVLKFYNSNRSTLKELVAAFLKAFVAVFVPSATGVLTDLTNASGGHIHISVVISALAAAFLAAVYAGVHAGAKVLKNVIAAKVKTSPSAPTPAA